MYKRGIILALLALMIAVIEVQGSRIFLAYLTLFPVLVYPVFYYYRRNDRKLLILSAAAVLIYAVAVVFRYRSPEFAFLGGGTIVLLGAVLLYDKLWNGLVAEASEKEQTAMAEFNQLKGRYDTRLDSLHRLENQVSSLVELFEIARDFSECLSFEAMAKLLREKIMPELPFKRMRLLLPGPGSQNLFVKQFVITADGWDEAAVEFEEKDAANLQKVLETGQVMKLSGEPARSSEWLFPLVIDARTAAILTVQDAVEDDFVRYEVLVAHLVLQVKKIKLYETVKELSIVDDLTGVYVRRHFLERFGEEVERSIKYKLPFAVLMLDIDHFKRYNDNFGHLVGDATLKEVARLLRHSLRKVDIVARYGGEEFIAVLPETTAEAASEIAERVRSNIARHHFNVYDVDTQVTISLGVSLFPSDIPENQSISSHLELGDTLIRYADKALYRAKEEGRNRVYRYQDL